MSETCRCPLSPAQRHLWLIEQSSPGLSIHNSTAAVRLSGNLDADALERALNAVVAGQESLRETIETVAYEPVALIHRHWPLCIRRVEIEGGEEAELDLQLKQEISIPFSLETEPGIRSALFRLSAFEHVLTVTVHRLVCDFSSETLLWRELGIFYRAFLRGVTPDTTPPPMQWSDYAAAQVERGLTASPNENLTLREERFQGVAQPLELPADRPRPPTVSYKGARERLEIAPAHCEPDILAAALIALIYRYSGKEDIVLGIEVPVRDRKELDSVIGCFAASQVLRTAVAGDTTFRELLARVQNGRSGRHADKGHPPPFRVAFKWRDRDNTVEFIGPEGLIADSIPLDSETSKFDLTLIASDRGDKILLEMEYSTSLFGQTRIVRMLGHYRTLLEAATADPGQPLAELPILTPLEQRQALIEWNQTAGDYPKDRTLSQLFEEQAARTPHATAVVFGDRRLTYGELNDHAARLALRLRSLEVGPGVLAGICVERSLEMMVGLLAILKAGGAYVPLDPDHPSDRLEFILDDCQPRVLLTQKRLQSRLPRHKAEVVWLDHSLAHTTPGTAFPPEPRDVSSSDPVYLLYTSGSTGKPKGVLVSNRALVNFLFSMQHEPGMRHDDTLLAVTTLSFDIAGLELFLPLICGSRVVIAAKDAIGDGARLRSLLEASGATIMQATPATWRLLLDAGWTGSPKLKILCGGEAWPPSLARLLLPRCGSLWNMYGPTETTIWSSVSQVEADKPVLIGLPIANTTFYVVETSGQLAPIGSPGELYIGGDGLAEGYFKRSDLTDDRFVRPPFSFSGGLRLFKTGDLVRRLPDGRMEYLHRLDQQVKVRGFRIELQEIENTLSKHPAVSQCVTVLTDEAAGDKRLVACVVPVGGSEMPSARELRNFLKHSLPAYMIPAEFIRLDKLKLTPNGKVDRVGIAVDMQGLSGRQPVFAKSPPRTSQELALTAIWEKILSAKITDVRDDFFELGGHSLLAVQLFAHIEAVFEVKLPIATLYEASTIEDLARILSAREHAPQWTSLVAIQPAGSRPPFFCFHGDGGNVLIYRSLAHYLGPDQPVYGLQAQGLDGSAPMLTTVEEMARLYVREIRAVQPRGAYLLGGYCSGGSIAYEVAQQLRAAGEEVALVALFDTMNWHMASLTFPAKTVMYLQRIVFHAAALLQLDSKSGKQLFKAKGDELRKRIGVWRDLLLTRLTGRRLHADSPGSMLLGRIWRNNEEASRKYVPLPYRGVITDFRPAKQYLALTRPGLKWGGLAKGGQKIVIIPGYPAFMLLEPFVKYLAAMLTRSIDDAIQTSSAEGLLSVRRS